jgi:predicted NAD-dependent protein-ADP-ribosyltransferase YbiA (DUF1768 family)
LRNPITSFTGKHDFLALDYPVSIVYKRKTYPSVAAVMQAEKARLGDTEYRKNLKEILGLALHHKFTEHEELQERLLDTGEDDIVTTPAIVGELLTLLRYHLATEDEEEGEDDEEAAAPAPRQAAASAVPFTSATRQAAVPRPIAPIAPALDAKNRERMLKLEENSKRIPLLRVLWPAAVHPFAFRVGRKSANTVVDAFLLSAPRGKKKRREWYETSMATLTLQRLLGRLAQDRDFRAALLKTKNFPLVFRSDIQTSPTASYSSLLMELRSQIQTDEAGRARLSETTALQPGRERREGEDMAARLRGLGFRF